MINNSVFARFLQVNFISKFRVHGSLIGPTDFLSFCQFFPVLLSVFLVIVVDCVLVPSLKNCPHLFRIPPWIRFNPERLCSDCSKCHEPSCSPVDSVAGIFNCKTTAVGCFH